MFGQVKQTHLVLWICVCGHAAQTHCAETVQIERFCCTMLMHLSGYLNEDVKKQQVNPTPLLPVAREVHHKAWAARNLTGKAHDMGSHPGAKTHPKTQDTRKRK